MATHPGLEFLSLGPPDDGALTIEQTAALNVDGNRGTDLAQKRLANAGFKRATTRTLVENPALAHITIVETGSPEQALALVRAEVEAFRESSAWTSPKVDIDARGQAALIGEARSGYGNVEVVYAVGQLVVRELFVDSSVSGALSLRRDTDALVLTALGVATR